jgi:hypothetical protein
MKLNAVARREVRKLRGKVKAYKATCMEDRRISR